MRGRNAVANDLVTLSKTVDFQPSSASFSKILFEAGGWLLFEVMNVLGRSGCCLKKIILQAAC